MWCVTSPLLLSRFFVLWKAWKKSTTVLLGVGLWVYVSRSLCLSTNLGSFQPSFHILPTTLSFLLLGLPQFVCWHSRQCLTGPLGKVHFYSVFLFSYSLDLIISIVLPSHLLWFILLPVQICIWMPLVNSLFQLYFSITEYVWFSFCCFLSLLLFHFWSYIFSFFFSSSSLSSLNFLWWLF